MMEYVKDIHETPCPFCGSKRQYVMCGPTNIMFGESKTVEVEVCCHQCGARVDSIAVDPKYAEMLAMQKWNHRADVRIIKKGGQPPL